MPNAIIPAVGEGFVELAATSKGKLFRKQILRMNESFLHPANPSKKIHVDEKFAKTLVDNFNSGIGGIVQFPFVDAKNRHVESPEANRGEVVGLSYDDKGVYATIDVRRDADSVGSTVLGASAMMNLNYQDRKNGDFHGPTLLHVAATNRPYLNDLGPYEQIALSDVSGDELVMLSRVDEESVSDMSLEEMLAALKRDHGIDVADLQRRAATADAALSGGVADDELVAALSSVLRAADADLVALSDSDEDASIEDVAAGVIELSRNYADTRSRLDEMERTAAEAEVDALVSSGRILPAQRDAFLEVRLSDSDLFESLVPSEAVVSLSEYGVTSHQQPSGDGTGFSNEVDRYSKMIHVNPPTA